MGKLGRFACIFVPMLLSIGSLLCLLLVFMGGLNKNSSTLRGLYYFRTDTSKFKSNPSILQGTGISPTLVSSLIGSATSNKLYDFYEVYMWNYCAGSNSTGTEVIQFCSPRQAKFVFNPFQVWGLNGTTLQKDIPGAVNSALNAYTKGAQWMFIAYTIAFWVTAASIVVGIFAICSRIGSCITTIVAGAATLFTFLSALTSTILFSTLVGALDGSLKAYNIKSSVGTRMMALDWLAVAFSLAASLFWFISICCCSGRSNRKERRSKNVDTMSGGTGYNPFNANRGYQPLGDDGHHPYAAPGAQSNRGMEMQDFGGAGPYKGRETAYEPFRHDRV